MKASKTLQLVALGVGFSVSAAGAVTIEIDSTASSFFFAPSPDAMNADYVDDVSIQNYQVGYNKTTDEDTRNWFIFDLSTLSPEKSIASATLSLYLPLFAPGVTMDAGDGYSSIDPFEVFGIFDVPAALADTVTAGDILDDSAPNGSLFDAWFDGTVESGTFLGEGGATEADQGMEVLVTLNLDGLAAVEGALGGTILFGGALLSVDHLGMVDAMGDDIGEGLFHHTHPYGIAGSETPAPTLILEVVPEPSTSVLILGATAACAMHRRRGRPNSRPNRS